MKINRDELKIKRLIEDAQIFLLDLDGTVYIENQPIGDMRATLQRLRLAGKKLVFLTNNSSKTAEQYFDKLSSLSLIGEGDYVYTSAMATAEYLAAYYAGQSVYLMATDAVKREFEEYGVSVVKDGSTVADLCVLAYDVELNYTKLKEFNYQLVKEAVYFATHPDAVCPAKDVYEPDVGSMIKLFECSSGRVPDVIIGKPYTVMGDMLKRKFDVPDDKIIMVGDRLHTDIRFANNNRFKSLLVLSGETTLQAMLKSEDKPDLIMQDLNDVTNYL